jgi:amidase
MKSIALVEESLNRIESLDRNGYALNSVLATADNALDKAREYDDQNRDLPLQGIPILIKDNIEAIGLPATAGSLALANTPVTKDSTLTQRLRDAGAVIVGSTNLSEWANIRSNKSTSGWSAVGGLTANPWKHGHSAGGSSSGSGAAVAAGLTQWAIGSETDGSIVCPASLNGCVGIKPTVGSIPRDGMIPISASQDSPGPITQTVSQASVLLDVLTQKSIYSKAALSDQNIRIGIVPQWMTEDAAVNTLFEETVTKLEKAGLKFVEVNLTPPAQEEQDDELFVLLYELGRDLEKYLLTRDGARVSNLEDVVNFNKQHFDQELKHFGQEHFEKALDLQLKSDEYRVARLRNKTWAQSTLSPCSSEVDVLIGCTYGPAWVSSLGHGDSYGSASWITMAPAVAGTPIGTIPMGLVSGLPVGLGFVTARDQEALLVTAMAQAERALGLGVLQPTFLTD